MNTKPSNVVQNRGLPLWLGRRVRLFLAFLLAVTLAYGCLVVLIRPSNTRAWNADQTELPVATVIGSQVTINNVRNTHYRAVADFDVRWETRQYDLNQLDSVWFVVEPFSGWRGPAHTFLSFGFADGRYLAVSVEIRKEVGESFSPVKGLLRQYELMYVIGDERDLIGLRANHRKDEVYLYPIRTTPERRRALLLSMLDRANALRKQPEFYNTLSNTCTTNIVDHINDLVPGRVPFSYKTWLPAHSDELAFDLGLIDTALPRSGFRVPYKINDAANRFAAADDFSMRIREPLPPRSAP